MKTRACALALILCLMVGTVGGALLMVAATPRVAPVPADAVIEEHGGMAYIIFDYEGMHYVVQFHSEEAG